MTITKIGIAGTYFDTEQTLAAGTLTTSGNATPSGGSVTITTTTPHGLSVGNFVTFSGMTTDTGYNGTIFTVVAVPTTTTFTINVGQLGVNDTAKTVQQVYLPGSGTAPWASGSTNAPASQNIGGTFFVTVAANCIVEYNPDNTGLPQNSTTLVVTGATWRTLIATSSQGEFDTDGFAVRIRVVSTTANTRLSRVK